MSHPLGHVLAAVVLLAFGVLMALHCARAARGRTRYSVTPRPWWRKPTATELADPGRDDLDSAHWLALKAAIGSPPAGERPDLKDSTDDRSGP